MPTLPARATAAVEVLRPSPRGLAVGLAAFVGLLLLLAAMLEVALSGGISVRELFGGFSGYAVIALVAYGIVGTALAWGRGRNLLGWLALGIAVSHGLALASSRYGLLAVGRDLPGAAWAAWAGTWTWVPAYWAVPTFLLLLFPDGRLPSRRWRPVAGTAVAGLVLSVVGWATLPYEQLDVPLSVHVPHPLPLPFADVLMSLGGLLGIVSAVAALTALLVRHRRSAGAERQQVRWVLLGGAATVVLLGGGFAAGPEGAGPIISAVAMLPLPAAVAVGVLRHRLWDVDVVINRSLVYGVLTIAVLAIYVATVSLLGGILGRGTGAPLVATALVAIGVNPVRQRVQTWVNEVLYGQRDDPYTALAQLVERLDAIDGAASALTGVADTVRRVLGLPYAAVEVRGLTRSHSGERGDGQVALFEVPLAFRGERIGSLLVAPPVAGELLDARDRRLLGDLARHIAVAVHTEQLTEDLRSSRRELVEAREEERRRIRRDLHDELGPVLASVAMRVESARAVSRDGGGELDGLPERLREAVRSVRSLVEGLRPAALDELGLAAAVRQQGARFASEHLTVELDVDDDLGPLTAAVDVAAYRIVSEALTNVVRHAHASRCSVAVQRSDGALRLVIADDGRGIGGARPASVGMRSMRERAAEVGGTCDIEPRAGGGTTVRASLPVAS